MKRNTALKDDFFDAESLALDDESALAVPAGEEADEPHRLQSEFRDPLAAIDAAAFAPYTPVLERRFAMAERLFQLVLCGLPFTELMRSGLEAVAEGVDAELACGWEIDRARREFFVRGAHGEAPPTLRTLRLPLGSGFAGEIANARKARAVEDAASDPHFEGLVAALAGYELRGVIGAPILVGGELFGLVTALNKRGHGTFEAEDLTTLEQGAVMLGKVLETRFFSAWIGKHG